jgi:hypothetical protein
MGPEASSASEGELCASARNSPKDAIVSRRRTFAFFFATNFYSFHAHGSHPSNEGIMSGVAVFRPQHPQHWVTGFKPNVERASPMNSA